VCGSWEQITQHRQATCNVPSTTGYDLLEFARYGAVLAVLGYRGVASLVFSILALRIASAGKGLGALGLSDPLGLINGLGLNSGLNIASAGKGLCALGLNDPLGLNNGLKP